MTTLDDHSPHFFPGFTDMYSSTLTDIVDGDTIEVDIDVGFGIVLTRQRVRLYGVNTPETRTLDLEEKARGKLATKFTTDCLTGAKILLEVKGYDSFHRWLSKVYYSKSDGYILLNSQLVDEGHAVYYKVNKGP